MVNVPKDIAALGYQQAALRKQLAMQLMAQRQAQQQRAMMVAPMVDPQQQAAQQAAQEQQAALARQAEDAEQQRRMAALMSPQGGV